MAVGDMFLKVTDIEGESTVDGHEDEIDIDSASFGATNAGTGAYGGGSGSGRADVHDLSFTKSVDAASSKLWLACLQGTHIDEVVLTMRKAGGDEPLDYCTITMKEVLISSFQASTTGPSDQYHESVSLNFASIKYEYQKQKEDGSGEPAGEFEFSVKKAKKQ